jgi:NADPH-dependent 2,4-dienoyl-CoA reductase/sulfur reductase-like enzyme
VSVVVIGAGPAGLRAALSARRSGAEVVLLDASDELGGQYWRHLPGQRTSARESTLHHGWSRFVELRRALTDDAGCEIVTDAEVWAIDNVDRLRVHTLVGAQRGGGRRPRTFEPHALVLATGAHDRTLPFSGWDLPGVYSAGAAQALAKGERIAIGRRVLVAGAGPFLLPVAASLARTGAQVVGVHEASTVPALASGWLARPWELLSAAGKATELGEYAIGQVRGRVPYVTGSAVIAAHGHDRVEAVTVARLDRQWAPVPGTERRIEVDAVCVSHGFTPRLELAIAAGCDIGSDRFVSVDRDGATSVPGVFAAGEITGIGGAQAAEVEGDLAGRAAATFRGRVGGPVDDAAQAQPAATSSDSRTRKLYRSRAAGDRFAARIESAHGIQPGWTAWLERSTLVCRCEEVTHGELTDAVHATCSGSLRSVKLTSRAGLGICQGRICGRTVEHLIDRTSPTGLSIDSTTDRRPLATPLTLGELAQAPLSSPSPLEKTHDVKDLRSQRRHRRNYARVP